MPMAIAESEQLTVRRILKVNHAGEYGAIRIYRAQLWLARRLYPDMVAFLEETLSHEIAHWRDSGQRCRSAGRGRAG